jgi:hypothetical protein
MAELFSAYLQKELTHETCVGFKPAAEMQSMQCPSRPEGNNFKPQNCSVAFINDSFSAAEET